MKLKELKSNPLNPRKIKDTKLAMLKKSYDENGDLSGIVYNVRSRQLVGGHQTSKVLDECEIIIEKRFDKPTKKGTVAEGYIIHDGEKLKYREVDVDDAREKIMNLAANKGAGEWDYALLSDFLIDIDAANLDVNLSMFDEGEVLNLLAPKDLEDLESLDDTIEDKEKKYILEATFPNDMDMMDVHDDLVAKGFVVIIK